MKRIIELEETKLGDNKVYKVKGCKTLIFDEWGFENLTKPFFDPVINKAKEFLNCKFIVISNYLKRPSSLFVGKIYEVKDGKFTSKHGVFPVERRIVDFKDLKDYLQHDYSGSPIEILQIKE